MSSKNYEVRHEPGLFVAKLAEGETAFIRYTTEGGKMSIDHTFTPPRFRGKGVARTLMLSAIEFAKQSGLKVVPACTYAVRFFKNNKGYEDLLHSE